jgi:leucyl aminopeptidase
MKVSLKKKGTKGEASQTFVVFVASGTEKAGLALPKVDAAISALISAASDDEAFSGKPKESVFFRQANVAGYTHVLIVGVGPSRDFSGERARTAAAVAFQSLKNHKVMSADLDLDSLLRLSRNGAGTVRGVTEGLNLAGYEFVEFKSKPKDKKAPRPATVNLLTSQLNKTLEIAFSEGEILADATNFARWLGDHAANTMTPTILAKTVQDRAKGTRLKVTVWDKARIKKENFDGLYSVSLGSEQEPRFIIMEYNGAGKTQIPVHFVGKGLTFDSGGISIKPSQSMDEMKYDMCGAGAVIGAMFALAESKAKVNVKAFVAATENMPGPAANKPGDILFHRNGKTTEVLNTDAEGRLVLSDVLTYSCEQKPQALFDAATLTGAIVVALGNIHTGVFTRDDRLRKRIQEAADVAGEQIWPMPLTDDHVDDMKGTHADLSNISNSKGAGSSTAAAYLEQFVDGKTPWAHFDVAGTAWNVANRLAYAPKKGASGVMVRTFVELAKSYF